MKADSPKNPLDRIFIPLIVVLSNVIPLAVAALMLFPETLKVDFGGVDTSSLPFFHAVLNGATALLLVFGGYWIKKKNITMHRYSMMSAFVLSAVFLVSYVISKLSNDPTPYGGEGSVRILYFFILITHIVLSVPVLPLAMFAIYRAFTGEISAHKKIVKWTYPIWLYVAFTGVLVYVFMAPYYA
jgi:putative membrane protein